MKKLGPGWLKILVLVVGFNFAIIYYNQKQIEGSIEVFSKRPALSFSSQTIDGKQLDTESLKGKVIVLNFWASWCSPCQLEFPSLVEFAEEYKHKGVVVLAVSEDDELDKAREFLKEWKLPDNFLVGTDLEKKISASYGTVKLPETYIIDESFIIRKKIINSIDWMNSTFLNTFNREFGK